jgi:hypothetical protein
MNLNEKENRTMETLIGTNVFVRTVTLYHVGRLVSADKKFLRLADASWVADTGRFGAALATGTLNEVERFVDDVWVALGAIVDITLWGHPLPAATR